MSASVSSTNEPRDVRPVIATGSQSNWSVWIFVAVLLLGGFMVYNALSASQQATRAPSVLAPPETSVGRIASPPPLRTPARFEGETAALGPEPLAAAEVAVRPPPAFVAPIVQPLRPQPVRETTLRDFQPQPIPAPQVVDQPEVVFDAGLRVAENLSEGRTETDQERVTADRLLNPSYTIPQGTVILAVLETAIDSTRPGGVRALVQRDVSSFDGSSILIPRGSRLYGEYDARLQRGQNRALVQWTRLIRPDGVTIALDSPSSDPLGRAGIRGRVDSKFLQRFGGALLNSVLDIGVGLAVNEATDGVIVALPGSTQNVQVAEPESIRPTLTVRHGTSVSVFVARDLDFSSVDP